MIRFPELLAQSHDWLVVERGKVELFDALPDRAIALDGYVQGPQIDAARMRFSFDHHYGCIRHVTRATCAQVWDALRVGLRAPGYRVYVNDVDADVVVAVWLLARDMATPVLSQTLGFLERIGNVVEAVALADALGPAARAYDRFLAARVRQDVMWPCREHKRLGTYGTCDLRALLVGCVQRLDAWASYSDSPRLERTPAFSGPCEIVAIDHDVTLARCDTTDAFEWLYGRGHDRCIVYSMLPDGTWKYTIGKRSEFIDGFPVGPASDPESILGRLAAVEPGWGGGTTIGGSPRGPNGSGSRLDPKTVLETVLEAAKSRRGE